MTSTRTWQTKAVGIGAVALALALIWLAVTPEARAAYGPLDLPVDRIGTHHKASRVERITFRLGPAYGRASGIEGEPYIGTYNRGYDVKQHGNCQVALHSQATPVRQAPVFGGGMLRYSAGPHFHYRLQVRARGHRGQSQWYVAHREVIAVIATPPGLAPSAFRKTVVTITVDSNLERIDPVPTKDGFTPLTVTRRQKRRCARLTAHAVVSDALAALRSVRIERGDPFAKSPNG